ncbi:MAG: GAF domain-containing protein [Chitinophagaceae bacterium]
METAFIDDVVDEVLSLHKQGSPSHKILAKLVSAAETVAGGDAVSSILILDKEGLLRNGASPRLPYDYLTAIDGLKPNPHVGTCAAAAATGKMVLTPDFQADDKWAELRHLPLALGFVGAWSMPIKNKQGVVLGTFGTYFREIRKPSPDEVSSVKILARAAALILSSDQK